MNQNNIIRNTFPYDNKITKGNVIQLLNKVIKIVNDEDHTLDRPFSWMDISELNNVELSLLNLYLLSCGAHEETYLEPTIQERSEDEVFDNYPVTINCSEKYHSIIIDTPISLASYRTHKGKAQEHLVANLVSIALRKYIADGGDIPLEKHLPYAIYVVRRCLPGKSSNSVPDTDNIEIKHLINDLVSILKFTSDSYEHLIDISGTIEYVKETKDCGTTFIIISDEFKPDFEQEFRLNNRSLWFLR